MKSGYELQRGHSWLVGVSLGVFIQYAACLQGGSEGLPQIPVTHPECTLCYPGDIAKYAGCRESGTGNVACTDEVGRLFATARRSPALHPARRVFSGCVRSNQAQSGVTGRINRCLTKGNFTNAFKGRIETAYPMPARNGWTTSIMCRQNSYVSTKPQTILRIGRQESAIIVVIHALAF